MTKNNHLFKAFINCHKKKAILLILINVFLLSSIEQAFAQGRIITGIVEDETDVLPGVSVVLKGTSKGIATNENGVYSIEVPNNNSILVFSYMGFVTQEITVGSRSSLNVLMAEDSKMLEEVVVVGYGTLEKRMVTTSVTSIRGENLLQGLGGSTIATALVGKVSGLAMSGTASPNSTVDFQLRGVASINAGKGPLIVIDGISGGDFRSVQQEDIKSIDVLKDGSAAAIYGTQAAGGVILITTKRPEAGPLKVTYTTELSIETVRKRPEMLSPEDFIANGLGEDFGYKTDWYDEVTNKNPFSQRHSINFSGGSKEARIYTTLSYIDNEGISIGDNRTDYSGRINADFKMFDNLLDITTNSEYRVAERDQRFGGSLYNMAMKLNPTQTPYDSNQPHGYNVWTGGWEYFNPVADVMLRDYKGEDKWMLTDVTAKLNLTSFLTTQATAGYQWKQWQQNSFVSAQHKSSLDNSRRGEAYHTFSKDDRKIFDWLVNYNQRFGDHDIRAVAGYSFLETNGESFNMRNYDFPVDGIGPWDIGKGTYLSDGRATMASNKSVRTRLIAFLGRLNYSYKDKYLLMASIRHEGSSKFGKNNKWGDFPAISLGWRISEESFMKDFHFINDLKFRGGYGVTGNSDFTAGKSTRMYSSDTWWLADNVWMYTYGSAHNVNNDLVWEEKKELNFGLDYSFLDNRIYGKLDIYQRKIDGMLYDISVSVPPAVHDKTTMNVGEMETNGWEFELGGDIIRNKDLSFSTMFRFSSYKQKINSLWGSDTRWDMNGFPAPGSPGDARRITAGSTIGEFWLWKFAGFTGEGQWMLYDKDGNAFDASKQTKKLEDKAFVGNAIPDLMIAWENNITWKKFDLNIHMRSWIGHDVFNTFDMYYGLPNVEEQNVLKKAFDKHKNVKGEKELCDYWLEDGTFLKIDAINLGYTTDLSSINKYIKKARIYLTIRDVACFSKYSGLNPEVNITGLEPGIEWFNNAYPLVRRFTLGAQLTF